MENTRNKEQIEVEGSTKRNKTLVVAVVALSLVAVIAVVVAVAFATRINRVERVNATDSVAMADELPAETVNNEPCGDYPFTSLRKVVFADVASMEELELRIMRNEIYARHGYIFDSKDMHRHFSSKDWYEPVTKDVELSEIEKFNVDYLKVVEDYFSSILEPVDDWHGRFMPPVSHKLTFEDLMGYDQYELCLLRNGLYARYGYIFDREDLREFFSTCWWYRPVTKKVELTEIEKYNVALIKRYEKERYGVAN
jgi:hypothetical protein